MIQSSAWGSARAQKINQPYPSPLFEQMIKRSCVQIGIQWLSMMIWIIIDRHWLIYCVRSQFVSASCCMSYTWCTSYSKIGNKGHFLFYLKYNFLDDPNLGCLRKIPYLKKKESSLWVKNIFHCYMYVYWKYRLLNLKRTADIWKGHLIFEKDTRNLKNHEIIHKIKKNTQNVKKHLIFEKDTQNVKKTPEIWKWHPKSEKEFYLACMFKDIWNQKMTPKIWNNTKNLNKQQYKWYICTITEKFYQKPLKQPKSEKDTHNLKRTPKIWKRHPKSETSMWNLKLW